MRHLVDHNFKLSKFIVCTDAGLASQNNRKFNNVQSRSYILTQSLKKLKKHLKEWALDPTNWTLDGKTCDICKLDEIKDEEPFKCFYGKTFYKERWINKDGLEQRFIVSYSLKYRDYQRKIRKDMMDSMEYGQS